MSTVAQPQISEMEPAAQLPPAVSGKAVLLHCLRQHVRRSHLYQTQLEMIDTALSSNCIGTGEALQLLVKLDGAACLLEPEGHLE